MIPNKIILHHSLTKDSGTVSWNAIRRYHIHELDWNDIGYHFGIEYMCDALGKGAYEILFGRMPNIQGAHTVGHNYRSIGICFVGNYDIDEVPQEMWDLGVKLVAYLIDIYHMSVDNIFGHRDFANKTCPGKNFSIIDFKDDVWEKI